MKLVILAVMGVELVYEETNIKPKPMIEVETYTAYIKMYKLMELMNL